MDCEMCGQSDTASDPVIAFHDPAWPDETDVFVHAHAACGDDQHYDRVEPVEPVEPEVSATQKAVLDRLLDLEFTAWQGKQCLSLVPASGLERAEKSLKADQQRLFDALDALSLADTRVYGDYRLANKWW